MSENQNIEYKESWRDEYLKWICGFANAQGGRLYIGIDDAGNVVGVEDIKKLLEDELTPEVEDKDVTVRKVDLQRDIKSLLSYAVGCMFGWYSLDVDGLAYAGGEWDASKYKTYLPDADNVIPITDEEYFADDIVGRFVTFIKAVYGEDTLEKNRSFIALALGTKGNSAREVTKAAKRKEKLQKQLKECQEYDEKIAHLALSRISIDLDDGVKVNYRKVQTARDGKSYEVLADSKNIMAKQ